MNWTSPQPSVDSYINKNIYNNLVTDAEGIDMRQELHWILYGKTTFPTSKPKGHWVVFRKFDRTRKSPFYSERTKEGVGGPAYIYTDSLLRTRRVPTSKSSLAVDPIQLGGDLTKKYLYYLEHTINPNEGDQIFEIVWDNHALTPSLNNVVLASRYTIKNVHEYRLENGNIQYWIASTEYDEVNY